MILMMLLQMIDKDKLKVNILILLLIGPEHFETTFDNEPEDFYISKEVRMSNI